MLKKGTRHNGSGKTFGPFRAVLVTQFNSTSFVVFNGLLKVTLTHLSLLSAWAEEEGRKRDLTRKLSPASTGVDQLFTTQYLNFDLMIIIRNLVLFLL